MVEILLDLLPPGNIMSEIIELEDYESTEANDIS